MGNTTYTKLRSGEWGIRSTTRLVSGMHVTVSKRDGSAKMETVDRVVWSGGGVWLASVKRDAPSAPPSSRPRTFSRGCRGCGGPVVSVSYHRAMDGYCGSCAFDEFDM